MVALLRCICIETSSICFSHRICFLHLLSLLSLSLNHWLEMNLRCVRYFSICNVDDIVIVPLLCTVWVCRDFKFPLLPLLNAVEVCFNSLIVARQFYIVAFEIFDIQLLANLEFSWIELSFLILFIVLISHINAHYNTLFSTSWHPLSKIESLSIVASISGSMVVRHELAPCWTPIVKDMQISLFLITLVRASLIFLLSGSFESC